MTHWAAAAAAAQSLQSCPTLCDPIDGSPPGSTVPGILQARTLEWVAISFSNGWKWKVKVKSLSRARLLATPWTTAHQAPPSMGFSRQEYWSGVPLPSPDSLGRQRLFIIYTLRSSPAFLCSSRVGHGVGASLKTKHTQPSSEPERRNWQWRWFNKQGPPKGAPDQTQYPLEPQIPPLNELAAIMMISCSP